MNTLYRYSLLILAVVMLGVGCASKKRKKDKEPSRIGKFYHNTTAYYNGYFNANELLEKSYLTLQAAHTDNYNEILPLYDYEAVTDPKVVYPDLDKAIEKVTRVSTLHGVSDWVDDCYVMMGEAQYLKQDYETAEATFAYFKEEFNPGNPFGRNYQKKKKNKDQIRKEKKKEKEEEQKKKAEKKEEERKEKEEKRKEEEEERKRKKKEREEEQKRKREAKKKEQERKKKEREEARKKKKRSKKGKGKRSRRSKNKKEKEKEEENTKEEGESKVEDKPLEEKATETRAEEPIEEVIPIEEEKEETLAEDRNTRPDEDDEDEVEDNKKEKVKKDKTAYSRGMIWYAKTLVKRDKFANASYLVKRMRDEGKASDDELREIPVILADIAIKDKNYADAIGHLDQAIELANKKRLKARYSFVKGQLLLKDRDYKGANAAFANAKKWAKTFEMEFMSELSAEKTDMFSGSKSRSAVVSKMDKMAGEAKYEEYLDQIYYTKGEILLEDGNFEEALESFSMSIRNNTNNMPLKQETYYRLANLFYDKEEFVEAKSYFDSTLQVLTKEDPRYNSVSLYATNLEDIARNINIVELQDSLLGMVSWSDDKIEELAERLVEEQEAASLSSISSEGGKKKTLSNANVGFNRSAFFAYDEQSKQRGKREFDDKWGEIKLEDDWRRSDKSGVFSSGEEEQTERVAEDGYEEDAVTKMIESIKSQIPYDEARQSASNNAIQTALFDLGKDFRDKIKNYPKSSETHEDLLSRYPNFENKLDVYYYLYLSYLDQNNMAQANVYKNKLLTEFPDTEYAKALSDPNYAAANLTEAEKLEKYYKKTYDLFEKGEFSQAQKRAEDSDDIFGKENSLRPKFALLNAMAIGNVKGKEEYIKALRDVVRRFPNTSEKARADEILRFLQGDEDAFSGADIKEVDDIFSLEDDNLHYVAVVMYDTNADKLVNAKIEVSNYNKKYHKLKKLQISDGTLNKDKKTEIILVRRFENKSKAMDYYNEVVKSQDEFINPEIGGYTIYPISQRNYRKMVIERTDSRYRVFFEKYYLGK